MNMRKPELEGRVAIVTGGAMGIGRAAAEAMSQEGALVVIADIDAAAGAAATAAIAAAGGKAHFVETDVSRFDAMKRLADEAVRMFGGIDILVNNAARAIGGVVDEIEEDTWNLVLSTNLSSVWRGMRVCVPHMRRRGKGAVVNMSSVQALAGFKGWAAYAAAKGGINALTQQAAIDLAPAGIRVNAIAPGTILTPLNEKIFATHPDPQGLIASWNKAHPLGRFGEAKEVADAVVFLASDRSSFITGEILRVDGGLAVRGE
jgi:NAD(P)-dependent dehydrogenase (short-subunit alcohol dehydrogenase family)